MLLFPIILMNKDDFSHFVYSLCLLKFCIICVMCKFFCFLLPVSVNKHEYNMLIVTERIVDSWLLTLWLTKLVYFPGFWIWGCQLSLGGQRLLDNFYQHTNLYETKYHFNYCHWRIPSRVAAEYSKRIFLGPHDYSNLGYCISLLAENSIYHIRTRVRTLNTSSGGRCWEWKEVLGGGSEHPLWGW